MPLRRTVPLLVLCAMAALAQTAPGPSMLGSSPGIVLKQPGNVDLSCRLCAAPTEPGAVDGTNRTAIDKAIRSLGPKLLLGVGLTQTPSSGKFVRDPKPMRRSTPESTSKVNERTVITRNSPCSVPLVRVPIDPNVDPLIALGPLSPTAPMPQVQVPAPPCDELASRDPRLVTPSRR